MNDIITESRSKVDCKTLDRFDLVVPPVLRVDCTQINFQTLAFRTLYD